MSVEIILALEALPVHGELAARVRTVEHGGIGTGVLLPHVPGQIFLVLELPVAAGHRTCEGWVFGTLALSMLAFIVTGVVSYLVSFDDLDIYHLCPGRGRRRRKFTLARVSCQRSCHTGRRQRSRCEARE